MITLLSFSVIMSTLSLLGLEPTKIIIRPIMLKLQRLKNMKHYEAFQVVLKPS